MKKLLLLTLLFTLSLSICACNKKIDEENLVDENEELIEEETDELDRRLPPYI